MAWGTGIMIKTTRLVREKMVRTQPGKGRRLPSDRNSRRCQHVEAMTTSTPPQTPIRPERFEACRPGRLTGKVSEGREGQSLNTPSIAERQRARH